MDNKISPRQAVPESFKSSNKSGNPWHDPRNGEFTSGPNGARTSPTTAPSSQKNAPREKSDAQNFIDAHQKDAAIIAASLNVPTENILGLSGIESLIVSHGVV